ncbi:MAG: ABC transporter ATP-binding protein [Ignisphaera sp.]|uniref:ABC transporter ATP-binding protein n=1 Tax=Ignisphaera aggregans TaxID=334771 RepID=A0A7C4JJB1_9CREN
MSVALRLRNISATYRTEDGKEIKVLENLSLNIFKGEVLGIVGRSGYGKTTLLKIVAGILKPTKGSVEFLNGENGVGRRAGIMFQSPLLLPWRTVLENVLLPIEIIGEDPRDYVDRALELLKIVGLEGFEDKYPWELSSGMQQRVALCRALIHKPQLLLLDEPFGALDAITREEMWLLLQTVVVREGCTTILVTHDIREALFLSDRVVVIGCRPGRVVDEIKIDIPRPRQLDALFTSTFNNYVHRIRNAIGDNLKCTRNSNS